MSKSSGKSIRLQKYIADCGVTSRRKAETLISEGKVKVNGHKVTELGTKVDIAEDVVMVAGQVIDLLTVDHIYLVMNKPRSVMTTVTDPEGRKTVMDFIPIETRVYPVGRLDYLSEGLLIFTNDGDLANKIIHPKYEISKTYEVKVFGRVTDAILKKLRAGTTGPDGDLKPKSVRIVEQLPGKTWLEFRLVEGKNREIRRICEDHNVVIDKLKRIAIGQLAVVGIAPGKWEYVTKPELMKLIGINKDGSKRHDYEDYQSPKKSIDAKKYTKKQKEAKVADSAEFSRYRKEEYYATIKLQKELKEKKIAEIEAAAAAGVAYKPSFEKTGKPRAGKTIRSRYSK